MNLAVKLWKDEPINPMAYPGAWPCDCIQEGDPLYQAALDSGLYSLMSLEAYNAYRDSHQSEYDAWAATQVQNA